MNDYQVLLVCTGNTCRSPMAEVLAREVLQDRQGVSVASAGVFAGDGNAATPEAVEAMRAMGLDLSPHRSRGLTRQMIDEADQVYTMTASHRRAVLDLVPDAEIKVQRLDPDADIDDPIGGDLETYRATAEQIRAALEKRLKPESQPAEGAAR
jgi:protein-tyrosine phosphatase